MEQKVVVLDDDPTGVQTVHDIPVYTNWEEESIRRGFEEKGTMFFILTNSRSMGADATRRVHEDIARRVVQVSRETGKPFVIVSRSDSTLRGHYPLETQVLYDTLRDCGERIDGEILMPFFPEGGRYTIGDVHYVAEGSRLVPAGQTEFARDKTFGYTSSNLREWIEEKSGGRISCEDVASISIGDDATEQKLMALNNFEKMVVNAVTYEDVKAFVQPLRRCMAEGKHYLFRSAAALPKVLGGVTDRSLLTHGELSDGQNHNGGLIVAGSHVSKTTRQLERLHESRLAKRIVLNQHLVMDEAAFAMEQDRVRREAQEYIQAGYTVVVQTRRERFDLGNGDREAELRLAVKISDAVTGIVGRLEVRPRFLVAKGGITSSEIGVKGLGVKRALVLGQILPGIPVWKTGKESRFPGLPYIIFPGNVGEDDALAEVVKILQGE